MRLSTTEVERIAELAKLGLTAEEIATFREQLSDILDYAGKLREVDTSSIPPTATVLPVHSVMDEDKVRPSMPRDEILFNAPHSDGASFRVWTILDD
jgi:aspartyl-tRNA(Asn)/glutamyl-tRNA(Gln) amidotransferase subunit C